ncbi:MBL fold metallo-hydrolase [Salinisphaera sp. LB1]|uniref:MBL fold metallo-hydrolase n=1 Tax=Salinisphaera sp. LB1 TaxID=2183911 RepID=UPI000D707C04|nr:MBL fold metallo-hydrolase [Salinisphaera sp. LB1]AWN15801.1 beta-lactamase [Salinisphaera sp. LB1]
MPANPTYRIGNAEITRVPEIAFEDADIATLFPDSAPDSLAPDAKRWGPRHFDARTGKLRQSVHAWLVKTPAHTLLIDTGAGNDKERPEAPALHRLDEPFLARLEAAGASAADIDHVLFTHLHSDHVGWNTTWHDGRWQPTFTNALHVFSKREYDYNAALAEDTALAERIRKKADLGPRARLPSRGFFGDSVQPVADAGLAHPIDINETAFEGFVFHRVPGHSIDQAAISFTSNGETALFWGDVCHHPLQVRHTGVNSMFCEFPEAAVEARLWALGYAADHEATVFTTHFGGGSVGHVVRDGDGFDWCFSEGDAA